MQLANYLRKQYDEGHLHFVKNIVNKVSGKKEEVVKRRVPRTVAYKSTEPKFEKFVPILLATAGIWPAYWVYRGLAWHYHRGTIPLTDYIHKTFYKAKIMQAAFLVAAVLINIGKTSKPAYAPKYRRSRIAH